LRRGLRHLRFYHDPIASEHVMPHAGGGKGCNTATGGYR